MGKCRRFIEWQGVTTAPFPFCINHLEYQLNVESPTPPNSRPTTREQIRGVFFALVQDKEFPHWLANINRSHPYSINCITKKFPFINSKGSRTWKVFLRDGKGRTIMHTAIDWHLKNLNPNNSNPITIAIFSFLIRVNWVQRSIVKYTEKKRDRVSVINGRQAGEK